MEQIIEMKAVNKYYRMGDETLHALRNVGLTVERGGVLGYFGTLRLRKNYAVKLYFLLYSF